MSDNRGHSDYNGKRIGECRRIGSGHALVDVAPSHEVRLTVGAAKGLESNSRSGLSEQGSKGE